MKGSLKRNVFVMSAREALETLVRLTGAGFQPLKSLYFQAQKSSSKKLSIRSNTPIGHILAERFLFSLLPQSLYVRKPLPQLTSKNRLGPNLGKVGGEPKE